MRRRSEKRTETKNRREPGHAQPADARQKKRQLNKGKKAADGTTRIHRRCPPKAQEDGRNAASTGHGDRCSFRARMRSVTLAPTMTASQTGNPSSPSRSVRGRGGRSHAAGDARSRFGRTHPLSGRRLPASSCGEAAAPARGMNRVMTGADLPNASRRADGLATSAVLEQKHLPA